MIKLTTLKGSEFFLNADLIEKIEEQPDTMITLIGGKKLRVSDTAEKVVEKVITYKRKIFCSNMEVKP